jgi:hypothetical protein
VPDGAVTPGEQRSLPDRLTPPPTWDQAGCEGGRDDPSSRCGPASGRGQGKPARARACWTATHPATRAAAGRALTTTRRLFPYLPGQSGYNKRLRRTAELLRQVIRAIACDTAVWIDDVWVVDSTPVECGRTGIGVAVRVLQRILALTAAIWHNDKTGQATLRSLVAYDH